MAKNKTSIPDKKREKLFSRLGEANTDFQKIYPGDKPDRQPVHTVYGGANLFAHDTAEKISKVAVKNLITYAPDFTVLAKVLKLTGHENLPTSQKDIASLISTMDSLDDSARKNHYAWLSYSVYNKVLNKLKTEAVEDFRIDFEDGFGNRPDQEEDDTAVQAAKEVALGMKHNSLPPFIGIRIKPFTEDLKLRGVRTLDIFFNDAAGEYKWKAPRQFRCHASKGYNTAAD